MADWRPSAAIVDLKRRARILASIRAFFAAREVVEVDTPMLSSSGLTCPSIESFLVQTPGTPEEIGYLHTSPEFPMKRLIAAGIGDCYQLSHVFRAEESGRKHNPEFMLLEWYRVGWDSQRLIDEVAELIIQLFQSDAPEQPPIRVEQHRYADLFQSRMRMDPLCATSSALQELAIQHCGTSVISATQQQSYERDDWLTYLMAMVIEPSLPPDVLTFVTHYPRSQAALARVDPEDPRTALRFECYLGGLELANGFDELTDADEQLARFADENAARMMNGQATIPIDHHLIAALADMPPTSGVALGVDRLMMLLLGKASIAGVMTFPATRA